MQTCDMLAMAISLKRYMSHQTSPDTLAKIESDWLAKHRDRLKDTDSRTPRQVLRAYANDYDLTLADIDSQLEWDTWDYESLTDITTTTSSTDDE